MTNIVKESSDRVNAEEFLERIEEKIPPDLKSAQGRAALKVAATEAYYWHEDLSPFRNNHVHKVLEKARTITFGLDSEPGPAIGSALTRSIGKGQETTEELGSKPAFRTQAVASRILAEKWESWCDNLRKGIFGQAHPPFNTVEEASAWIEAESRYVMQSKSQIHEYMLSTAKQIESMADNAGISVEFDLRRMEYLTSDGNVETVSVFPGSPLQLLELNTRKTSERTFFAQNSLVNWVLTGQTPVNPPELVTKYWYRVTDMDGNDLGYLPKITFTVFNGNLSHEDLSEVMRTIRDYFGKKKGGTQLSEEQVSIYKLVMEHGGPPPKGRRGAREFWENIRDLYNSAHPSRKHRVWQSTRKAYFDAENRASPFLDLQAPNGLFDDRGR